MTLNKLSAGLLCALASFSIPGFCYSPGKADFSISIKDLQIHYKEFAVFAVPGEKLILEVTNDGTNHEYRIDGHGN
jgi:hypothetical protein